MEALAAETVPEVPILLVSGEASGDLHSAALLAELRKRNSALQFFGMGGSALRAEGMDTTVDSEHSASVMGLTELFGSLSEIYAAFNRLLEEVDRRKPALAILVDFPDFNLQLASRLKKRGIKIFYFISPQLWAWRQGRVKTIKKNVEFVAPIFPFEVDFYRKHGVASEFVGHPFLDRSSALEDRNSFLRNCGLSPSRPVVALLPGSRSSEVERLLGPMLGAFQRLQKARPGIQGLLPVAPTLSREWLEGKICSGVKLVDGKAREVLHSADVGVVASGTATVEAALAGLPIVIVYKLAPFTRLLSKYLVRGVSNFGMPNLILGKKVVEELLQEEVEPGRIAQELELLLGDESRRELIKLEFKKLSQLLRNPSGMSSAARSAELILECLD